MELDFYPEMELESFSYEPIVNDMPPAKMKQVDRETLVRELKKAINYSPSYYSDFYGLVLTTTKKQLRRLCRVLFVNGDKYYKKLMRVNSFLSSGDYVDIDTESIMYPIIDYLACMDVEDFQIDFTTKRLQFKMKGRKGWTR